MIAYFPVYSVVAALVFGVVSLSSLSACSSSQDAASDQDERIESQLASLDSAADLTDLQAERIRGILMSQEASRLSGPPPRRDGQAAGVGARAQREAQRAATDRQIEAVLTDDQVEAFRAWRASQPDRPRGRPPRGR